MIIEFNRLEKWNSGRFYGLRRVEKKGAKSGKGGENENGTAKDEVY